MSYFLGVDIGGTKSHALIADETGRALGMGESGSGNHESVGWDGLRDCLSTIVESAISEAGIQRTLIAGAGYGIAGYDWPSERPRTAACIEPLNIQAPFEIVNDAIVGLLAGAPDGWGVALVAGTGSSCWGWDRQRRTGRVTGQGITMGEFGGASEIIFKAIHAISAEWTMRGPATRLSKDFAALVGATSLADLIEGICENRYWLDAKVAPLIFKAASEGDQVAMELVTWAGHELGGLANGVIRQLNFEKLSFDVVLVGGIYEGGPMLIEPLRETIFSIAPDARLIRLEAPPVVGGVLLAMEIAGLDPRPARDQLIETTREWWQRKPVD
jgi:N-acetylglucosamine kinase-like BadF-type ATPase